METKEWKFKEINRSKWGSGPWDNEADKYQWTDEATGYPCLIVRHETLGHLCGYVGVPADHPVFGQDTENIPNLVIVHGGITYADICDGERICHVQEGADENKVWWVGFDCAHAYDLSPGMNYFSLRISEDHRIHNTYRDVPYVQEECRSLAKQLKELAI